MTVPRVAIVGSPGSGKTTLARKVAERTGARHIEIDAYFHQANWTPADRDDMRARIRSAMQDPAGWVADGNYDSVVGDLVRGQAQTIVVFDLPRSLLVRRVLTRTIRRAVKREELWNGNREPLTNFYRWDPDKNIIRWTWVKQPGYQREHRTAIADGSWKHADVVVCGSPDDAARWLDAL